MEYLHNKVALSTLKVINKVRIYLRINTISDFLSADGSMYDRELVNGKQSTSHPHPSFFRYRWPTVITPTKTERDIWQREICYHFNIDMAQGQRKSNSQIKWLPYSVKYSRWTFSSSVGMIYERQTCNSWRIWTPMFNRARYSTRSNYRTFIASGDTTSVPTDVTSISIKCVEKHITIISIRNIETQSVGEQNNLGPNILELDARNSHINIFLYNIILNNGTIVSDGSYDKGVGAYAFLAQPQGPYLSLRDIDYRQLAYSSGAVEGSKWDMNSYRAELQGILAAIEFTNKLCGNTVTSGSCTLYCDSKGALFAAFGHKRPTPKWASYDLVRKIRNAVANSPIKWKFGHIKGHQDANCSFEKLDSLAQGNIIVDYLASQALASCPRSSLTSVPNWLPVAHGQIISGELASQVRHIIYKPLMIDMWARKFGIPHEQIPLCQWPIFFRSLSSQPNKHSYNILKYHAHLLPVGKNLLRRKHSQVGTCAGCGDFEDHDHLITCTNPEMTTTYEQAVENIDSWLTITTSEDIKDSVLALLRSFRRASEATISLLLPLAHSQSRISRQAFYGGVWHISWLHAQAQFHQLTKNRRSAEFRLIQLLHKVQLIPIHMWDTRNAILHSASNESIISAQNDDLNLIVDAIFSRKPHSRLMSHCDNAYFNKHDVEKIKKMKIRRKTNWVTGANLILTKYDRVNTAQSVQFTSFFQWDDHG